MQERSPGPAGTRTCFVIMPFSPTDSCSKDEWTRVFEKVIKPAVEEAGLGYTCVRSRATRGNIVAAIMESLRDAHVVIADLTDQNANVFYELGVRHALQDRTILIAQDRKFIPFDLKPYANHVYDWRSTDGIETLRNKMRELLLEIDESPSRPDNPVSDFLRSRAMPPPAEPSPQIAPTEAAYAQPLAGPGSEGLDVSDLARRISAASEMGAVRAVVRLTRAYFRETWATLIGQLNSDHNGPERIKVEEIYDVSLSVIRQFSGGVMHLEEFGLALVEREQIRGVNELLRIAEDWISLSRRQWQGRTLRPVTGAPAILALRMLCTWGAKAADVMAVDILKALLSTPLSSTEFSGQPSNLALVDRKDLFWPDAMLDHADLCARYLSTEPWENPGVTQMFASKEDFQAGVSVFLFLAALIYSARHPDASWPLYPGFKLIPGASAAIARFMARVAVSESAVESLAAAVPEPPGGFKEAWGQRVQVLNNAELGGHYWVDWRRVPASFGKLLSPSSSD